MPKRHDAEKEAVFDDTLNVARMITPVLDRRRSKVIVIRLQRGGTDQLRKRHRMGRTFRATAPGRRSASVIDSAGIRLGFGDIHTRANLKTGIRLERFM